MKTLLTLLLGALSAHAADLDFRSVKSSAVAVVQVTQFLREGGYEPRVVDDASHDAFLCVRLADASPASMATRGWLIPRLHDV